MNITSRPIKININISISHFCVTLYFDKYYYYVSILDKRFLSITVTTDTYYVFRYDVITRVSTLVIDAVYLCYTYMKKVI